MSAFFSAFVRKRETVVGGGGVGTGGFLGSGLSDATS